MFDSESPWAVGHQAPLSMELSWEEYWSGLPFPSPGDLPYPGIEPESPALQVDSLVSETPRKPTLHFKERFEFNFFRLVLKGNSSVVNKVLEKDE